MLTFLFALVAIWTLFWFAMLALDWGNRTSFSDRQILCPTCASALYPGSADIKSEAFDNKSQRVAGLHRADLKMTTTTATESISESKTGFAVHNECDDWPELKKAS